MQENIVAEKSGFQDIKAKKTKLKDIDKIAIKNAILDNSKVVVDETEFEDIKTLVKKQIIAESKEKKLITEVKALRSEVNTLKRENNVQKRELFEFKSLKNHLDIGK